MDIFGPRNFSFSLCRWMSPDRLFADNHLVYPQSRNQYVYGKNNPISFIDIDGEAVISSLQVKYYTVKWSNAARAIRNVKNHFGKNLAGMTSYRFAVINIKEKATAAKNQQGTFTGKCVVKSADVLVDQIVELPTWKSKDSEEQSKFDAAVGILKDHELKEHVPITLNVAQNLDQALPGKTGNGSGSTGQEAAQKAADDMSAKLGQMTTAAREEADKQHSQLDRDTEHGTKEKDSTDPK